MNDSTSGHQSLLNNSPPPGIFSGPHDGTRPPRSYRWLGRLIVIVVVSAVVVGAGIWGYFQFLAPAALARATSEKYVTALTTDDVDWAAYLSADTADFSLLESAAQAVKGEYKLADTTEKNGSYYFLYSLTNASNKYARTVVVHTAKGYRVSMFVYSMGALALIPRDGTSVPGGVAAVMPDDPMQSASSDTVAANSSGQANSNSSNTSGSSGTKQGSGSKSGSGSGSSSGSSSGGSAGGHAGSVAAACLVQSDYVNAFADGDPGDGSTWSAGNPYSVQVSFNPGSTDYVDDFEIGNIYADWVQFYKNNSAKNYTIHVGSVTYSSDTNLASQRASRSSGALSSVGVPASKIVTDAPQILTANDDIDDDGYATLTIVPGC